MSEDCKFINLDLIESVRFFPKREYEFYSITKEGEVISSFLGLFKRKAKKDLYYFNDIESIIRRHNYQDSIEIDKVVEYLGKTHPKLYFEDGKIYYYPSFKVRFSSGKVETFWVDSLEEAEKFIKKFKDNNKFLDVELW